MIRVVVLTTYFHPIIGGVESNAGRLARYLQAAGAPTTVVTKKVLRELPDADAYHGARVRRIGPHGDRSAAGKWLFSPYAYRWLVRNAGEYDVVCVIDYRAIGAAALAARRTTRRPVVVQAQTTGVLSGDNADPLLDRLRISTTGAVARVVKSLPRQAYDSADAFACISHDIEREALRCGIPADRVHFMPNAIDMSMFVPPTSAQYSEARRTLGVPDGTVCCLFVGRLSREKGVMELLEAWRQLAAPDALLLIAGPDMPGHAWDCGVPGRAFVERHGLTPSVRFLGPATNVVPLLHAADVVVQPSHFEALGLSAIEALATGRPVVASAIGGLLDFMKDGVNGRLVPPQDAEALARALGDVVADAAVRARLAAASRASVVDDYDEQAVFGRMLRVMTELAERP